MGQIFHWASTSAGRLRNPYSLPPDGDYCLVVQSRRMLAKYCLHQFNSPFSRYIGQSNYPAMTDMVHIDQLAKISIYGNQNTRFLCRLLKEFPVTGIGTKCAGLKHVMPFTPQPFSQFSARTSINKESHLISVSGPGKT